MSFEIGEKVTYVPAHGEPERGKVKSLSGDDHCFVVYHCAGDWRNYQDYTAARTPNHLLRRGWDE